MKKLMIFEFLQRSFSHGYVIYSMRDDQEITNRKLTDSLYCYLIIQ